MTDQDIIDQLSDRQVLALTAIGEAAGDKVEGGTSIEERLAVMIVIRNRAAVRGRFGDGFRGVCLKRLQFSCWNQTDPNRARLLEIGYRLLTGLPTPAWVTETLALAVLVIDGTIQDYTNGATHYYAPAAMKPAGSMPAWAKGVKPCARVGGHIFFKGV